MVPRQCPVGLESRPAERLPASLAQKQRSPPAQSLEESPQRQGQRCLISSALAPIPTAPFLTVPVALSPAFLAPVFPVSPAPGGPAGPVLVCLSPAVPVLGAPSPAFPFLTSPSPIFPFPSFLSPAFPAPAPSVAAVPEVAFVEFPILLVMGHFELGQVVVNFV